MDEKSCRHMAAYVHAMWRRVGMRVCACACLCVHVCVLMYDERDKAVIAIVLM